MLPSVQAVRFLYIFLYISCSPALKQCHAYLELFFVVVVVPGVTFDEQFGEQSKRKLED